VYFHVYFVRQPDFFLLHNEKNLQKTHNLRFLLFCHMTISVMISFHSLSIAVYDYILFINTNLCHFLVSTRYYAIWCFDRLQSCPDHFDYDRSLYVSNTMNTMILLRSVWNSCFIGTIWNLTNCQVNNGLLIEWVPLIKFYLFNSCSCTKFFQWFLG